MKYNYKNVIVEDILEYIEEEGLTGDRDELSERLNDDLWMDDGVTGNGSGSYFYNAEESKEAVLGDPEAETYIHDLIGDFGMTSHDIAEHLFDWEYWDVSIRCYLLGECIEMALDKLYE